MDVNCAVLRVPIAEPIAWNAAFEGANIVTSVRESTVSTSLAEVNAPAREVRFAATAVLESEAGMVSTVSMMWITPPVKLTFWHLLARGPQHLRGLAYGRSDRGSRK